MIRLLLMLNGAAFWGVIVLALAVVVGMQAYEYNNRESVSMPPIGEQPSILSQFPDVNALKTPSFSALSQYNEVLERPLFSKLRRAEKVQNNVADVKVRQSVLSRKWLLTGVIITDDKSVIMLQAISGDKKLKLKTGQWVDGWRLDKVMPHEAMLTAGAKKVYLPLFVDKKSVVAGRATKRAPQPTDRRPWMNR